MTKCILGIDIGTTTVKAVIFDQFGYILRSEQMEYPIHYPERSWAEQDPEDWWEVLKKVLKSLMYSHGGKELQILALGVSSQAPSFLPLDAEGNPLNRAMIWMDRRADQEANSLSHILGTDKVIEYSKNRADPFYTAAKLLWFKNHESDKFRSIHKILQANGYINLRLTGVYSMDDAHASITQLYDVDKKNWAYDVLQQLDIPSSILPDVYESGVIIGEVTEEAAKETGLPAGIPVIAGTVDGAAAALEAGVIRPDIATEMTGTSSVLLMSNNKGWYSPELITMNHALPGQTLSLGAMTSTGASLKWYRDQFCHAEVNLAEKLGIDAYDLMNREAEGSNPHNEIVFLPYMMGERSPIWDTDARGMFFGLSLNTSRADLTRAIMEGAAYALKNNLDIMEQSGNQVRVLRIIGGSSKSQLWNQIKADVLNREIEVIQGSGGAPLGNAILAGMAVGFYPDPEFVLDHVIQLKTKVSPSESMNNFYRKKYEIYLELYQQNKEQFKKLSALFKET
jgi:xylulokinase